jgi:GAF domain-containing protein
MQQMLPAYADVPDDALTPLVLTNVRNLLEAVRVPHDDDHTRAEHHFRLSGETRLGQGITADEMLQAWRIGLEVVREEAHSVAKRLEATDTVLLEFVEATLQAGDVAMRMAAEAHREGEIRELERLAAEQAALRRVATMVASECSPSDVFATVAEELSRLLDVSMVRLVRFEPDDTATLLAEQGTAEELLPVGTNAPLPRGSVIDRIFRTGEPARVDDYSQVEGPIGDNVRQERVGWAAGGPVVVEGRLWGAIVVCSSLAERSSDTEERVAQFAELVSTAISNVESRAKVERLAAEQAALRRVAELVARQAPPEQVFVLVTHELSHLLDVNLVWTARFEPDGSATILATRGRAAERMPAGTNIPLLAGGVFEQVLRTGRPARLDNYAHIHGLNDAALVKRLREDGLRCGAGGPIVVDGRIWGAMLAASTTAETLPPGIEDRIAQFAELVSTAISNVESRARVERLVAEQAALRRVAELVARQAPPDQVFALVTDELNRLLGDGTVSTARFEPNGTATIMATRGAAKDAFPPGKNVRIAGGSTVDQVFRTGRAAHVENYAEVGGEIGPSLRQLGLRWGAAGPIVVDGRLWGAMAMASTSETMPPGTEQHVAQFAELVSTAISNVESRAKVERLAAEQAALRRVATLVAREHSPDDLFGTLAEEVGMLLGVDAAVILRYEADSAIVVATWSERAPDLPIGVRFPLDGTLVGEVKRAGEPRRREDYDPAARTSDDDIRGLGIRSAVASPIVVEGATWGVIAAVSRQSEPLPLDAESRLVEFSRHAAMAVANAKSRSDLAESRARIVRAGDEARRRFERDLHDGAQQRLVSLGLELRSAEATVPPEMGELRPRLCRLGTGLSDVLDDLRELSRGLHPAVLSEDGLSPALSSLALRSAVPVELRLDLGAERFEEPLEVAAYYVVSEALANTAKHARASRAEVSARQRAGWLELTVSDDGRGGADAAGGSGLTGLVDRVEAIGGTIQIDSPPGLGTAVHVKLPVRSTRS